MSKKNASMAIWLGKQYLGQKDHDEKNSTPPNDLILNHLLSDIKDLKDRIKSPEIKPNDG